MENNKAPATGVEQVFVAEKDGKEMDVMVRLDIQGSMHVSYPVIISFINWSGQNCIFLNFFNESSN